MEGFFLCNGNETQEIVKPTGAHDFCFRRFIGMVCTRKPGIFDLCRLPTIHFKCQYCIHYLSYYIDLCFMEIHRFTYLKNISKIVLPYTYPLNPLSNLSNNSFWYSLSNVPYSSFGYASSCNCCQLSFS